MSFDWSNIDFVFCFENPVALKSYQWISNLIEKVFTHTHTHTHALHELSHLFKISICREICSNWTLKLSIMFLHIFEMLFDYYISWLYMRVLEVLFGKYIFLQFFLKFHIFNVKRPDGCDLDGWTVKWHVRTR